VAEGNRAALRLLVPATYRCYRPHEIAERDPPFRRDHMRKRALLALAALLVSTTTALASEDVNADDWAVRCTTGQPHWVGWCAGTVANFLETLSRQAGPPHRLVCWQTVPNLNNDNVDSLMALAKVATDYLRSNPSYAKMPAPALMLAAFMRAWPCGTVGPLR